MDDGGLMIDGLNIWMQRKSNNRRTAPPPIQEGK